MTALMAEHKACAMCKNTLPLELFTPDARMRSGRKSYCRDCCKADARRRYAADPERARAYSRASSARWYTPEKRRVGNLRAVYNLSHEEYLALLAEQGGCCAICRADTAGGRGQWHVDHEHDTGVIRGLLCATCNVGLGMFKDSPERLTAAARYLQRGAAS